MRWVTLLRLLMMIFVIILALKAVQWSQKTLLATQVESVTIEGDFLLISKKELEEQVIALLTEANSVDQSSQIDQVKQVLHARPGVRNVEVRRAWPSGITIKYQEKKALAIWNNDRFIMDDLSLLERFATADSAKLKTLPVILSGSENHVAAMLAFSKIKQYTGQEEITQFSENGSRGGRVEFQNGVVVDLGMTDIERRLYRMQKLIKTDQFWSLLSKGSVVDLRYTEGFSLNQPKTQSGS